MGKWMYFLMGFLTGITAFIAFSLTLVDDAPDI